MIDRPDDLPPPEEPLSAVVAERQAAVAESLRPRRQPPSKLFSGAVAALIGAVFYYAYSSKTADPLHLYLGLCILVGSTLPAILWAKRNDFRFPIFEVFMLTGVNTYAIPLLSGHQQLQQYSQETITTAAFAVLFYQIVANVTYSTVRARPGRGSFWNDEVISRGIVGFLGYGMALTTAYTMVNYFTEWIPPELNSLLRAVCFGVGIISTFIQSRMWGQGTLPHHAKGVFIVQIALQVIFSWASLYLIAGISILVLALIGYVFGGKKLPVLALVIVLPAIGVLHNGKSVMREKYWENGAPMPTITEVPAFFAEWIGYGLDPVHIQEKKQANNLLLERTSLMHILCLVVEYTPSRQPYLAGETYGYVPAQFVPSFLWKGKPPAHVATYRLSVYYGLQRPEDTTKTTIAFGMLSEAYANFGFFGAGLLGFVFAAAFKRLSDLSVNSPILSYPGLLMVVLTAWSFQSEQTMAAWLSSLFQACVSVLGIPFAVRNFLGG